MAGSGPRQLPPLTAQESAEDPRCSTLRLALRASGGLLPKVQTPKDPARIRVDSICISWKNICAYIVK